MTAPWPTIGFHCQLACLWEATARKPGNVHRFQDFDDVTYLDFATSAAVVGLTFDRVQEFSLGALARQAVVATRSLVASNTNLGMVLLLAPLAKAAAAGPVREHLPGILGEAGVADTVAVYQAIRLANPGGLGRVQEQDVAAMPTLPLREAMALATDRDLIARQYANGFQEVLHDAVPALERGLSVLGTLEEAIVGCHLHLLSRHPDSLIARKCGPETAAEACRRAAGVLDAGWPHTVAGRAAVVELDAWLRGDGHRRNPGTTADLVAASLFVALREGIIILPPQCPWSRRGGEEHGPQ